MNEQNMTRRKEVDLEITDFLWEIVRNWRVIAICLIIGAVLLCGYQYIKDSRNADTTADEVVEELSLIHIYHLLCEPYIDHIYGSVIGISQFATREWMRTTEDKDVKAYTVYNCVNAVSYTHLSLENARWAVSGQ